MLGTGLLVVHDGLVGGDNEETEVSGGEDGGGEILEFGEVEVESGGDNTALVEAAVELNNDLSGSGIIDNFEFVDVSMLLHLFEELDHDLGNGSQQNLYG